MHRPGSPPNPRHAGEPRAGSPESARPAPPAGVRNRSSSRNAPCAAAPLRLASRLLKNRSVEWHRAANALHLSTESPVGTRIREGREIGQKSKVKSQKAKGKGQRAKGLKA